jgi:hypothetical protein
MKNYKFKIDEYMKNLQDYEVNTYQHIGYINTISLLKGCKPNQLLQVDIYKEYREVINYLNSNYNTYTLRERLNKAKHPIEVFGESDYKYLKLLLL